MNELPIACTLTPSDLQTRRDELLPGVIRQAEAIETIDTGLRLRFASSSQILSDLVRMIDAERQCCRFLKFHLTFDEDLGPIWLEVQGPPGTGEFLASLANQPRHEEGERRRP